MAAVSLAMPTKLWDSAGRECGLTFLYLHIQYNIVPPLGAYKSQLVGTYIFYRCCFYMANVYCDYTAIYIHIIYILYTCMYIYSSCHLIVGVFARKMHSTTEFPYDSSEQVCDSCCALQDDDLHHGPMVTSWLHEGLLVRSC